MEFLTMKNLLQKNFEEMVRDSTHLFEVELDKEELWSLYLESFPLGTNDIFRERREHDCSCCRQFIRNFGNVVIIKNNKVSTIWDFSTNDTTYQPVLTALSDFVRRHAVSDVYFSKDVKIGTNSSVEVLESGESIIWDHFYLELPSKFVDRSCRSLGDIQGTYRDTRNVFKRSLDEISKDSLLTVLELISQDSLYKGAEWKAALNKFMKYKDSYDKLRIEDERANYAWENSVKDGMTIGRIRNNSMGTLLTDISEGMDLEAAVKRYEKIVAPTNYKRPKNIYTKRMWDDAKAFLVKNGYEGSLGRKYAVVDDITINNVLFSNKDAQKRMMKTDIFSEMEREAVVNPKKFQKTEEISVENFIKNVLPTAQSLELYLENKHSGNMVSLIAPEDKDSKTMFKWSNSFGWAYSGNITDSMKERVKSAGGKVDGVLRFSIQWNDIECDLNDLDAHCIEPKGNEIYYSRKAHTATTGQLDVDIINPTRNKPAVENITWSDRTKMEEGTYKFFVQNFSHNGGRSGFRAEIEFDGQIYSFDYPKELRRKENVVVAEVTYSKVTGFSIKEKLPSTTTTREIWNLQSNQFIPVSVMMYSPNYWDEQNGIGNKHYFFMLKDCINPECPNGFYNEFLKPEFDKYKHVLEAMGAKLKVTEAEDQLSGIGFSSTKRDDVLVKVIGATERVLKIKF